MCRILAKSKRPRTRQISESRRSLLYGRSIFGGIGFFIYKWPACRAHVLYTLMRRGSSSSCWHAESQNRTLPAACTAVNNYSTCIRRGRVNCEYMFTMLENTQRRQRRRPSASGPPYDEDLETGHGRTGVSTKKGLAIVFVCYCYSKFE